jgi:hypothetical protein
MENFVNKLNEYLKQLGVTGIRFEFNKISRFNHVISIILPRTELHNWTGEEFSEYRQFSDINNFFENTVEIYIEIKIRRMLALKNMSIYGVCNSTFAYHKINLVGIKFLEILSNCDSLEELELKIAIHLGK